MDINELKELIKLLEESALSELEIEEDNRRVRLSKQWNSGVPMQQFAVPAPAPAPVATPAAPVQTEAEAAIEAGLLTIESPMVGTFYAASGPGDPPFVLPGTRIEKDQTVCIVEAMKIMNEVASNHSGIIEKVLVENGQPVEFGQPLFHVRHAG